MIVPLVLQASEVSIWWKCETIKTWLFCCWMKLYLWCLFFLGCVTSRRCSIQDRSVHIKAVQVFLNYWRIKCCVYAIVERCAFWYLSGLTFCHDFLMLCLIFISYVCIIFLDSCETDDRLEIATRMGQNCISCGCFGQNRKLQSGLQVRISRPVIRC